MNDMITKDERIFARINPEATKQMTVSNRAGGVELRSIADIMEFAKGMAISDIGIRKHLRSNVGACFAICLQAFEWKLTPFAVANKSYLVNDQIAYEAQLIHAVILTRAPIAKRPSAQYTGDGPTRRLKVFFHCTDGDVLEYESPLFDRIKPKNSPLWVSDPDQQLWYYSVRAGCRRHFPDVILGVYTDEEISEEISRGPGLARDVTPVAQSSLADKIDQLVDRSRGTMPSDITIDPETGEILPKDEPTAKPEQDPEPEKAKAAPATKSEKKPDPAPEPDPDRDGKDGHEEDDFPPEDPLLVTARGKSFEGSAKFRRWHGSLSVAQEAQIAEHYPALLKAAKAVDKANKPDDGA